MAREGEDWSGKARQEGTGSEGIGKDWKGRVRYGRRGAVRHGRKGQHKPEGT